MSTQTITAPVILDSTGQSILTALGQIKEAVQPTNSCLDIDISLPTTGWSGEGPYTYTYSNTHITSGCAVKVNFLESASSGGVLCLDYEKVTGGVQFTSDSVPTATIPVRIHVLNADATSTTATTADAVSTDAVSGASNVQDALTTLNTQLNLLASKMQILKTGSQSGKLTFTAGWSGALFCADSLTIGDSYSGGVRKKGILGNDVFTVSGLQVTFSNTFKNVVVFTLEGSEPVYSAT